MHLTTRIFFARRFVQLLRRFARKLIKGGDPRRHTQVSRDIYERYDDREIRAYLTKSTRTVRNGKMADVPFLEVREAYVAPIRAEISALADRRPGPVRVLEVGCGNGTNLKLMRDAFGDRVALTGLDISGERIRVGQAFWKDAMDGIRFEIGSGTDLSRFADDSFDLVFTVHCIEQIPYEVPAVLREITRVTADRAVFVEPVFELGNATQRLYAITGDQLRTLLPELHVSGLTILSTSETSVLANPVNKTGVVVATKLPPMP
jgi:SAM-dependent methyltransferase